MEAASEKKRGRPPKEIYGPIRTGDHPGFFGRTSPRTMRGLQDVRLAYDAFNLLLKMGFKNPDDFNRAEFPNYPCFKTFPWLLGVPGPSGETRDWHPSARQGILTELGRWLEEFGATMEERTEAVQVVAFDLAPMIEGFGKRNWSTKSVIRFLRRMRLETRKEPNHDGHS